MNLADAIAILNKAIEPVRGNPLSEVETAIITSAWHRRRYTEIDNYAEQTVKNRATKLWQQLSIIIGKSINKNNLKSTLLVLERECQIPIKNIYNRFVVLLSVAGIDRSFRIDRFDVVIWIPIAEVPTEIDLEIDTLDRICDRQIKLPIDNLERAIEMVMEYLENRNCAIFLECESISSTELSLFQKYRSLGDRLNSWDNQ